MVTSGWANMAVYLDKYPKSQIRDFPPEEALSSHQVAGSTPAGGTNERPAESSDPGAENADSAGAPGTLREGALVSPA